eukprot:1155239-Pelagomonas_calceolata.AAC.4
MDTHAYIHTYAPKHLLQQPQRSCAALHIAAGLLGRLVHPLIRKRWPPTVKQRHGAGMHMSTQQHVREWNGDKRLYEALCIRVNEPLTLTGNVGWQALHESGRLKSQGFLPSMAFGWRCEQWRVVGMHQ